KEKIIEALHELGVVQILDLGKNIEKFNQLVEIDKPLSNYSVISEYLVKIRAIESLLPEQKFEQIRIPVGQVMSEAKKLVESSDVLEINKKLSELQEKREELAEHMAILTALGRISIEFSLLESEVITRALGRVNKKKIPELENGLSGISKCEFLHDNLNKNDEIVLVIFDKRLNNEVQRVLTSVAYVPVDLPPFSTTPQAFLGKLVEWDKRLMGEEEEIKKEITSISNGIYSKVLYLREALELEAQKAEIAAKFGKTSSVCVVEGWIKKKDYDRLEEVLNYVSNDNVMIEKLRVDHHELAPTSLANPSSLRPFESFITFISIPKSYEFDPTVFFALVFPIMYGLMLGDVGYGIFVLLVGILGYFKLKGMLKDICWVLIPSGVLSIIFGILFGEIFGFEFKEFGIPFNGYLHRLSEITELLLITLAIGAVHVGFGFLLGVIKEIQEKKYRHAIGKAGWLVLEIGGVMLFLAVAQQMAYLTDYAIGLMVLAIVALIYGEGMIALIEIPKLIGNIFSYSRLMAVGLASVALAFVLNTFKPDPGMGLLIIPATLIFLFGHLLNFVLGIFEPFVQGARLHYVEFFSKFYEGGGYAFMPFKGNKKYTKNEVI
ncbi:V-type ATP synthase subunit I, partial [Candidatus Micrarchaeota archaeon]|nr:V-type ATP synthase subunit I [Candidatus Micrarchaeota archaeon]